MAQMALNVYWTLGNLLLPALSPGKPLKGRAKGNPKRSSAAAQVLQGLKKHRAQKSPKKPPSTWKALLSLVSCKDATRHSRISSSGLFLGKFRCFWLSFGCLLHVIEIQLLCAVETDSTPTALKVILPGPMQMASTGFIPPPKKNHLK